jgi:hypothetical protein
LVDTAHLPNIIHLSFTMEDCRAGKSESDEEVQ